MLVRVASYEPPWRDQPHFLGLYTKVTDPRFFPLVLLRGPNNDGKKQDPYKLQDRPGNYG